MDHVTTTVNIHEAKTHLSRLLEKVESGERIIIARAGRPIAELGPISKPDLVFGSMKGLIRFDYEEFMAADADVAQMFEDVDIDVSR